MVDINDMWDDEEDNEMMRRNMGIQRRRMTADTPARTPSDAGQTDPREVERHYARVKYLDAVLYAPNVKSQLYAYTEWVAAADAEIAALREKLEAAEADLDQFNGMAEEFQAQLTTARAEAAALAELANEAAGDFREWLAGAIPGCCVVPESLQRLEAIVRTLPADLTAALDRVKDQVRNEALEEAAVTADENTFGSPILASAIRALKREAG